MADKPKSTPKPTPPLQDPNFAKAIRKLAQTPPAKNEDIKKRKK